VNGQQTGRGQDAADRARFTYNGTTLMDPTGKRSPSRSRPSGWSDYQTDLSIIADNLKTIGINATSTRPTQRLVHRDRNGNFQAAMHWSNGGVTPYDMYQNIMDGRTSRRSAAQRTSATTGGSTARGDGALKQYANATDDATRTAALNTLEQSWSSRRR